MARKPAPTVSSLDRRRWLPARQGVEDDGVAGRRGWPRGDAGTRLAFLDAARDVL
jgi:hypothetical protein